MKRWCGPSARLRTIGFGSLSSKPQKAREQEPEVCAPSGKAALGQLMWRLM